MLQRIRPAPVPRLPARLHSRSTTSSTVAGALHHHRRRSGPACPSVTLAHSVSSYPRAERRAVRLGLVARPRPLRGQLGKGQGPPLKQAKKIGCHAALFDRLGWVRSGLGRILNKTLACLEAGEVGHHCNRFCSLPSAPQQLCFAAKERAEGRSEGERAFMTAQCFAGFLLPCKAHGACGALRYRSSLIW